MNDCSHKIFSNDCCTKCKAPFTQIIHDLQKALKQDNHITIDLNLAKKALSSDADSAFWNAVRAAIVEKETP